MAQVVAAIPIKDIVYVLCELFGVSSDCAMYMFYRLKRNQKDQTAAGKYLKWSLFLQNGLVKLDSMIAPQYWKQVQYGFEELEFKKHNITEKMFKPDEVFKREAKQADSTALWMQYDFASNEHKHQLEQTNDDHEWTPVVNRRSLHRQVADLTKRRDAIAYLTALGLFG